MKPCITTTIPYVNSEPHIGFALELVQADAIARIHRASGATVRFQTGTDENALKNVEAARAAGVDPNIWVDRRSAQFRQLADDLAIGYEPLPPPELALSSLTTWSCATLCST